MTTPPSTASTVPANGNPSTADTVHEERNTLINNMHLLLGSKLRITMTDGRIVRGKFLCLDRLGNVILENAVESRRIAYIPPPSSAAAIPSEDEGNRSSSDDNNNDESRCDNDKTVFTWNTERSLSQAVIQGNRLAKVEIAKSDWEARIGDTP
jgi:small nuclear ribonucleoprotein (snRNP)-like protein